MTIAERLRAEARRAAGRITRAESVARIIARRFKAPCKSKPGDRVVYTDDTVSLLRKDGSLVAIVSREEPWFREPKPRKPKARLRGDAKGGG